MSKHHHQSKAEQIYNKTHGVAPFHHEKTPCEGSESIMPENIHTKTDKNVVLIQPLAIRIYRKIMIRMGRLTGIKNNF